MAGIVYAFAVTDNEHLGRFVWHPISLADGVGNLTVPEQVQEIPGKLFTVLVFIMALKTVEGT